MKSDLISSPSKSRTTATSVRNLLTRVVKQISAKTNGGSNSNKCDRNVEERIAEWKRRFTAEPGRVPGVIGKDYYINWMPEIIPQDIWPCFGRGLLPRFDEFFFSM